MVGSLLFIHCVLNKQPTCLKPFCLTLLSCLMWPMNYLSATAPVKVAVKRKLVIGLTFVCMFLWGQRSGSAPLTAFVFNHRSYINAWDGGKLIDAFDMTE